MHLLWPTSTTGFHLQTGHLEACDSFNELFNLGNLAKLSAWSWKDHWQPPSATSEVFLHFYLNNGWLRQIVHHLFQDTSYMRGRTKEDLANSFLGCLGKTSAIAPWAFEQQTRLKLPWDHLIDLRQTWKPQTITRPKQWQLQYPNTRSNSNPAKVVPKIKTLHNKKKI